MKKKLWGVNVTIVLCSLCVTVLLLEVTLRVLPLRGVQADCYRTGPIVGTAFYPGATLRYYGTSGAPVHRRVNSDGYLDSEHIYAKNKGVLRIGFFGDSWVEARQVALADTFFKQLEVLGKPASIETLSFGISGFDTLQAALTSERWVPLYDPDIVLYVFCNNDIGDLMKNRIENQGLFARLCPGGYTVVRNFSTQPRWKYAKLFWVADLLCAKSVLCATIVSRVRICLNRQTRQTHYYLYDVIKPPSGRPVQNQQLFDTKRSPEEWPPYERAYGMALSQAIIGDWKRTVEKDGHVFGICYIPLLSEVAGKSGGSWRLWLRGYCRREGIPLLDLTDPLRNEAKQGNKVYRDHFTEDGHRAFAHALKVWLKRTWGGSILSLEER